MMSLKTLESRYLILEKINDKMNILTDFPETKNINTIHKPNGFIFNQYMLDDFPFYLRLNDYKIIVVLIKKTNRCTHKYYECIALYILDILYFYKILKN